MIFSCNKLILSLYCATYFISSSFFLYLELSIAGNVLAVLGKIFTYVGSQLMNGISPMLLHTIALNVLKSTFDSQVTENILYFWYPIALFRSFTSCYFLAHT